MWSAARWRTQPSCDYARGLWSVDGYCKTKQIQDGCGVSNRTGRGVCPVDFQCRKDSGSDGGGGGGGTAAPPGPDLEFFTKSIMSTEVPSARTQQQMFTADACIHANICSGKGKGTQATNNPQHLPCFCRGRAEAYGRVPANSFGTKTSEPHLTKRSRAPPDMSSTLSIPIVACSRHMRVFFSEGA